MAPIGQRGLSAGQKAELWERWKQGESLSDIGRALSKHAGSVSGMLLLNGGVYRPPRHRSRMALTLSEREEISRGITTQTSIHAIAGSIGRSPSTVSREKMGTDLFSAYDL